MTSLAADAAAHALDPDGRQTIPQHRNADGEWCRFSGCVTERPDRSCPACRPLPPEPSRAAAWAVLDGHDVARAVFVHRGSADKAWRMYEDAYGGGFRVAPLVLADLDDVEPAEQQPAEDAP